MFNKKATSENEFLFPMDSILNKEAMEEARGDIIPSTILSPGELDS